MRITYSLILIDNGKEELIESSTDPNLIRRIACGKSMARRLKRLGRKLLILRDGRKYDLPKLETLCYQLWLEEHANENQNN